MKKWLSTILCIIMFLGGLSVLLYPTVANWINEKNASRVIADYNSTLADASEEDISKWFDDAGDYNRRLYESPNGFYVPESVPGYFDTLDITGTGIMGYIDIEKIKVHLPIYHGVDDVVLQVGAGHLPGSSLPVGGLNTHAVLSGHRGLPNSKLFTDLPELEIGDTFTVTVLDRVCTYRIDQIKVVLPSESQDLQIVPNRDLCTLITCTPYGINSHRMLVRGTRVGNIETESDQQPDVYVPNEALKIDSYIIIPFIAVPLLLVFIVIIFIWSKIRR